MRFRAVHNLSILPVRRSSCDSDVIVDIVIGDQNTQPESNPAKVMVDAVPDPLQWHAPWMRRALDLARQAFEAEEVPVGAIVVHDSQIIGEGFNQRESLQDPTAHAEMLALTQAAGTLGTWRLLDCTLYVTLEPCPMCAGAIVQARLPRVIYGTSDPKAGACHTLYSITTDERLNHQCSVLGGVLQEECRGILQKFFALQRSRGKK